MRLRAPDELHALLHAHYDQFRHEVSGAGGVFSVSPLCYAHSMSPAFTLFPMPGLPLDILQGDWWVPGSTARADLAKYSGKAQWQEILKVTPEVSLMWAQRAMQDHIRVSGV